MNTFTLNRTTVRFYFYLDKIEMDAIAFNLINEIVFEYGKRSQCGSKMFSSLFTFDSEFMNCEMLDI